MKKVLAIFGAGFVAGLIVLPESRRQMRRRVRSLLGSRPWKRQYVWSDADDRLASSSALRETMLDKTLADSFPASDPPSSIPNPSLVA